MKNKIILLLGTGFFIWNLFMGCESPRMGKMDQFNLVIADEINPAGLLPEYIEVDHTGKLVILTNRFNTDGTKYHHGYFVDASKHQLDSLIAMINALEKNDLHQMHTNPEDTIVFKVHLSGMIDQQRVNYMWVGSRFSPNLTKLISFCQQLPEEKYRYKLKEPHYFSTAGICASEQKNLFNE